MKTYLNYTTIFLAAICCMFADSETTTETDPEIQKLKDQKVQAELERDIAKAEKEKREAEFPKGSVTTKGGDITLDDESGYYAIVLAYDSVAEAANGIVEAIKAKVKTSDPIIIMEKFDTTTQYQTYKLVDERLSDFTSVFESLIPATATGSILDNIRDNGTESTGTVYGTKSMGALGGLQAASSLIGSAAEIASLFRVDIEVKGKDINVQESALKTEIANHLIGRKYTDVSYPELLAVRSFGSGGDNIQKRLLATIRLSDRISAKLRDDYKSLYQDALSDLAKQRAIVTQAKDELKLLIPADDATRIAELKKDIAKANKKIALHLDKEQEWKDRSTPINTMISEFDAFAQALIKTSETNPVAPISKMVGIEKAYDGTSNILFVDILSAGGEVRAKESIWGAGRISHVGSVTCQFQLVDKAYLLKAADVITTYKHGKDFKESTYSKKRSSTDRL